MFPPILALHSNLGKTLIETRLRVLDSAREYAKRTSYQGARFPWESALSGNIDLSELANQIIDNVILQYSDKDLNHTISVQSKCHRIENINLDFKFRIMATSDYFFFIYERWV